MDITLNGMAISDKIKSGKLLAEFISVLVIPHLRVAPMYALIKNYKKCYFLVDKYCKWTRKTKLKRGKLGQFTYKKRRVFKEISKLTNDEYGLESLQKKILADVLMGEGLSIVQLGSTRLSNPLLAHGIPRKHIPIKRRKKFNISDFKNKRKKIIF